MGHMNAPQLWTVLLTRSHVDSIKALADEKELVIGSHPALGDQVPLYSEVLIDSSGATGWIICVCHWTGVTGTAEDLGSLCRSLVSTGRKRDREIAGRIKQRAAKQGAPSADWPGEPPTPKPSEPRSIDHICRAWKEGRAMAGGNVSTDGRSLYSWRLCIGTTSGGKKIALDHRGVSGSTSRHVGVAIKHADRLDPPTRR